MTPTERKRAASSSMSGHEAADSKKQRRSTSSNVSKSRGSESHTPVTGTGMEAQSSLTLADSDVRVNDAAETMLPATAVPMCGFFGPLPQELEDLIFEFAYQRDPAMKFMTASRWTRQEEQKRRDSRAYVALPFPTPFVTRWLVSKRYLIAAASVWFASEPWDFASGYDSHSLAVQAVSSYEFCNSGLFHDFVAVVRDDYSSYMGYPTRCKKLAEMTLVMHYDWESCSRGGNKKYAWQEDLSTADFDSMLEHADLLEVRGLRSLNVECTPPRSRIARLLKDDRTEEEKATLEANTRGLEKVLRDITLQPKLETEVVSEDEPLPIYSRSKVFWTQPMENEATAKARKDTARLDRSQTALESGESNVSTKMRKDARSELSMLQTALGTEGKALEQEKFPLEALIKLAKWRRAICASEHYVDPDIDWA